MFQNIIGRPDCGNYILISESCNAINEVISPATMEHHKKVWCLDYRLESVSFTSHNTIVTASWVLDTSRHRYWHGPQSNRFSKGAVRAKSSMTVLNSAGTTDRVTLHPSAPLLKLIHSSDQVSLVGDSVLSTSRHSDTANILTFCKVKYFPQWQL